MLKYLIFLIIGIIIFIIFNSVDGFSVGAQIVRYEPTSGNPYYYNTDTEQTTWELSGLLGDEVIDKIPGVDDPKQPNYLDQRNIISGPSLSAACSPSDDKFYPTKKTLESTRFGYIFGEPIVVYGDFKLYDVVLMPEDTDSESRIHDAVTMYRQSGNSQPTYALETIDEFPMKLYYLTLQKDRDEYIVSRAFIMYGILDMTYLARFSTVPYGGIRGMGIKLMELLSILRTYDTYPQYPSPLPDTLGEVYRMQINAFEPNKGTEKAYRNQFRLSVKPESEGGWAKRDGEKFSIFFPPPERGTELEYRGEKIYNTKMMNDLYFDSFINSEKVFKYDELYYLIYPDEINADVYSIENKAKYNHFLMQLTEDDIPYLLDIDENIAIIDDLYRQFLLENYS